MKETPSRLSRILKTEISRKSFLTCLGGFAAGIPAGAVAQDLLRSPDPEGGQRSYAQGGEDIAADLFFQCVGLSANVTYLDVGAYDPVKINNTYFFYRKGSRGVLVEPNVVMCERLREVRPKDTTLAAGIGVTAVKEADYYIMTDPSWNTFSKEEAELQEKATGKSITIKKTIKMPLLNINDVMQEHFGKAPTFLSIDAEGLHLAILQSIDYARFRPPLICVETLAVGGGKKIPGIAEFMTSQGYVAWGGSFVNTLFVDPGVVKANVSG
jgi:FkbM family methyltransferase